jgi:hypothetical protein
MATKSETTSAPSLGVALKNLSKLIGVFSDVIFSPDGTLTVQNNGAVVRMKADLGIDLGGEAISLPGASLIAALSGRKNPTLTLKNSVLLVTDGRYRVELNPKQAGSVPTPEVPSDGQQVVIKDELWALISNSLPALSIDKLHAAQVDPNLSMQFTAKRAFFAVQDRHQLAYTLGQNPIPGLELQLQMPYPKAVTFFKDKPGSTVKATFGKDLVHAKFISAGYSTELSIPWSMDEQAPSVDVVYEKAKQLRKFEGDSLTFGRDQLLQFLDNSRAIAADDTRILLSASGSDLLLSAESSSGKIKSKIPLTASVGKVGFALELKFLSNVVKKLDEEVTLQYSDNLIKIASSKMTMVSATSAI